MAYDGFWRQIRQTIRENPSDLDICLELIREQKFSRFEELPSIYSILTAMYPEPADLGMPMDMSEGYFRTISNAGHEIIRILYRAEAPEFAPYENLEPSLLFLPGSRLDTAMVRLLLSLKTDFSDLRNQAVYDLLLQDYLYLTLSDWSELAGESGPPEDLLEHLEKAAASHDCPPPVHLRLLLEQGAPSSFAGFPLNFDRLELIPEIASQTPVAAELTLTANGASVCNAWIEEEHLLFALTANGLSWPFTCECGVPGCAGIWHPVASRTFPDSVRWRVPGPFRYFRFERAPALRQFATVLLKMLEIYRNRISTDKEITHGPNRLSLAKLEELYCRSNSILKRLQV